MPTSTTPVVLTVPFVLRDTKPRTTHFAEVKAEDAGKYLGAIVVLDNRVIEQLGAKVEELPVTITAAKTKPSFKLQAPTADAPKPKAKGKRSAEK
jgi:hypothetical protein